MVKFPPWVHLLLTAVAAGVAAAAATSDLPQWAQILIPALSAIFAALGIVPPQIAKSLAKPDDS